MTLQYELPEEYQQPARLERLLECLDECGEEYSCDNITLFLNVDVNKPGNILHLGALIGALKYIPLY